ncbi:hypothetical protein EYC59_01585 [Candidatus Saccharibacteria bacterium]|nr:MAG: hypothetical protein EYC59_01585 [Candidatus Saccharibacteria bacterium]
MSYPDKDYFPSLTGRNITFQPGNFCIVRNSYKAIFQGDGNFVVYNGNTPVFASNTRDKNATRLTFQSDGNLVIYSGYTPLWHTYTYNRMGASNPSFPVLIMQSDGNLVIYGPDGRTPYWSTWTGPIYY